MQKSEIRTDGLFLNTEAGIDKAIYKNCIFRHEIIENIDSNNRNGKNNASLLDELLYKKHFMIKKNQSVVKCFQKDLSSF